MRWNMNALKICSGMRDTSTRRHSVCIRFLEGVLQDDSRNIRANSCLACLYNHRSKSDHETASEYVKKVLDLNMEEKAGWVAFLEANIGVCSDEWYDNHWKSAWWWALRRGGCKHRIDSRSGKQLSVWDLYGDIMFVIIFFCWNYPFLKLDKGGEIRLEIVSIHFRNIRKNKLRDFFSKNWGKATKYKTILVKIWKKATFKG